MKYTTYKRLGNKKTQSNITTGYKHHEMPSFLFFYSSFLILLTIQKTCRCTFFSIHLCIKLIINTCIYYSGSGLSQYLAQNVEIEWCCVLIFISVIIVLHSPPRRNFDNVVISDNLCQFCVGCSGNVCWYLN